MTPTPILNLRVDEEMKERWEAAAEERGVSLSDLIRTCVEQILRRKTPLVHAPVPSPSESLGVPETRKGRRR